MQTVNTIIGSADRQIVVLLLVPPLLLTVMPVDLMMVRSLRIWSADRADLGLPDSISLFVVSSDSCVHHLHHRHHHHLHESVWFNDT